MLNVFNSLQISFNNIMSASLAATAVQRIALHCGYSHEQSMNGFSAELFCAKS